MNCLTLNKINVNKNRVDYFFTCEGSIQKYFKKENHLFLEYNYDLSDIPISILTIPFVANVIPLIWITKSTIFIKEIDQSFRNCLDSIRNAFQNMYPHVTFDGSIIVEKIVSNSYVQEREAASLFSGGLDALTTFIRVREKKPILITEYGWHDHTIQPSNVWEADKENAVNFAKKYGLDNILIQSNYGTFISAENIDRDFHKKLGDSWWHGFHHGLAIITAAVPIAFKLKINSIFIASSNTKLFKVTCASDPTIDNQIKFASGNVVHDGYELTRLNKIKVLTDYCTEVKELIPLRVCFKQEKNCCNCEKCLRTILGIVAEGKNPRDFGFDIPDNLSLFVKNFLRQEVKFFTPTFISMYWEEIQNRMRENSKEIVYKDLLEWFLYYDFKAKRKIYLLEYRIMNFFPILKRKIKTRLNGA